MTQRTVQRFAAAVALAAVLFLGAAAPAQARDLGPTHAWQRLQDLWAKAVSVLWPWGGLTVPEGSNAGTLVKQGPAVDPDGSPKPGSVLWNWGGSPVLYGRHSGGLIKAGPAVDPDGSPKPGSTAPASGTSGG